jgi:hypothetical protein
MPIPKYAAKRDENEPEIVQDMRELGAVVVLLNIPDEPDLLIAWRGVLMLVEVKTEKGKLSAGQRECLRLWRTVTDCAIVARCTQDVIDAYDNLIFNEWRMKDETITSI